MGDRLAMSEDPVSRAVRLLKSAGSAASVKCSDCDEVALSMNTKPSLGGSFGAWTDNPIDVSALFLRSDGVNFTDVKETLLVTSGAIVLSAQQVIFAGLQHDMMKNGFKSYLEPITHHVCNACTKKIGGTVKSLRLLPDARVSLEKDVECIESVFEEGFLAQAKLRLRCASQDCKTTTHTGTIRAITRQGDTGVQKKHMPKTCAMGALAPTDAWDMTRHGQLIYFSRHKGKNHLGGVLVWIVDQRLAVVQTDILSDLFPKNVLCYELTSLNALCRTHTHTYPRPCAICARSIQSEHQAVLVDLLSAPVHDKTCAQKCTGADCKNIVARLGPTPEQGTLLEQCIALPAKCANCVKGIQKHAQTATEKTISLPQIAPGDKPGKPSAAMVRETAMNALKHTSEGASSSTGFKRKERWIGDLKEGLYPGDGGNFHMHDGTWVYKENVDGVISKRAICGQWFREADGGLSVYEWGKRVQHEAVQK
jgi:hypothetical protein